MAKIYITYKSHRRNNLHVNQINFHSLTKLIRVNKRNSLHVN